MRQIVLGILVVAAVIGAYLGVAFHFEQVGKLKLMVADDVRVNAELKKKDVALTAYIPVLRDSAARAVARAVTTERRRTVAVAVSDTAAAATDSVIAAALQAAADSAEKARLDSVAAVVARERAARASERLASDSSIASWRATSNFWMRAADSTATLATIRLGRIDALEAENRKVRALLPSRAGSALRTAGAVVVTVLTCRYVVRC